MEIEQIISDSISSIREDAPGDRTDTVPDVVEDAEAAPTEGTDASAAPAAPEAPVVEPAKDPAKVADDKTPDEEKKDELDGQPDFTVDSQGRKRENKIGHSRVRVMVSKAEEKGAKAKEAEYAPKIAQYESRLNEMERIGSVMDSDPDRFVSMLAAANPAYQKFLTGAGKPAAPAAPVPDEMPQPDGKLPDGTPAYTPEGFQKVLAWQATQVENRLAERYKPIETAYKSQQAIEAQVPVVRAQMQKAAKWEGFTEHQDEIISVLQADSAEAAKFGRLPQLSLEDAYRQVVIPKLKAANEKLKTDRNTMRAELLKELAAQPASTATVATAVVPAKGDSDEPKEVEDIIRASIAGLKR